MSPLSCASLVAERRTDKARDLRPPLTFHRVRDQHRPPSKQARRADLFIVPTAQKKHPSFSDAVGRAAAPSILAFPLF
jgi:hypothetical protein